MMQTKEEQIEELKEELKTVAAIHLKVADKLQQQIKVLETPKQWEPKYNELTLSELKAVLTHRRLVKYVIEFGCIFWQADWEDHKQPKYSLYYDYDSRRWHVDTNHVCCVSGAVYMSSDCAEGLLKKLNSGEVIL